jgi:hypothetical protein
MMKKWNLKTTKPFVVLLLSVVCSNHLLAQSKTKLSIGASISPTTTGSLNTSSSDAIVSNTGQTYTKYNDSISNKETYRVSYGASVWILYAISKNIDLQTGLTYLDVGFQRQLSNLKYLDRTYPGIGTGEYSGIVIDKSNVKKSIDLNYRYQYLQIPILANFDLKRTRDLKFEFDMNAGIGLNFLLNHELQAKMVDSYKIEGKDEYNFDSTGYSPRKFALNVMVGGTMKYKYEKNIYLFAQPIIGFYPLSVSAGEISSYPYYFSLNLGLIYSLKK